MRISDWSSDVCSFRSRLIGFFLAQAEGRRNHAEETLCLKLRTGYGRGHRAVLRQVVQEIIDENGLAGADLAGDDHEALALAQPEAQIGQSPALGLASIIEAQVRRQVEGILPELEELGVFHDRPWLAMRRFCRTRKIIIGAAG